jgi:hypothetical protein
VRVRERKARVKEGGAEDTHIGLGIKSFLEPMVERSRFVLSLQIKGCGVCSNGAEQYMSIMFEGNLLHGHSPMVGHR